MLYSLPQFTRLHDDLGKREGRIIFAGEHTDLPHAWIDTSIKTGIRAAAEVFEDSDWTERRGYKYNKRSRRKTREAEDEGEVEEESWRQHEEAENIVSEPLDMYAHERNPK